MAQLASSAGTAAPELRMAARPLLSSVATTWSDSAGSSSRSKRRCLSRTARRLEFEMKWLLRPRRPAKPVIGLRGQTYSPRRLSQISRMSCAPSTLGRPAIQAALTAPTDVPTRRSGRTLFSNRARSIPTWTAPRLPPPERTKAVRALPFDPTCWGARAPSSDRGRRIIDRLRPASSCRLAQVAVLFSFVLWRFSRRLSSISAASMRSQRRQYDSGRQAWASSDSSWVCRSGASDLVLNLTVRFLLPKRARTQLAATTVGRSLRTTFDLGYPHRRRCGVETEVGGDVAGRCGP